ncbi:MAG: hypothetical protein ABL907_20255 [Hyphomicrobium sp.]
MERFKLQRVQATVAEKHADRERLIRLLDREDPLFNSFMGLVAKAVTQSSQRLDVLTAEEQQQSRAVLACKHKVQLAEESRLRAEADATREREKADLLEIVEAIFVARPR